MSREAPQPLDVARAHRHFSASCFNQTWGFIDKPDRTARDNEEMALSASASLWHWMQRPDCSDQNLSVGHWQLSRVYALVGQGKIAMRHAQRSLALAAACSRFYVGYAHEAIARAAAVLGDDTTRQTHIQLATQCVTAVTDPSEREPLEQDLRSLAAGRSAEA
jgi:hypothetical protein